MAFQGPSYGLSRECQLKAKFDMSLAMQALDWVRDVTQLSINAPNEDHGFQDQFDFADSLKDGIALCTLINLLCPGSVPKINFVRAPFKQAQKNNFDGPVIGVKVADQNKRSFTKEILDKSKSVIGLQAGTNKGATQSGMTPYGASRQIMPDTR